MWSYYLTKIFRLSLPAINHAQPEDHPASLHFYTLHHHNLLPATAGIKLKVRWWAAHDGDPVLLKVQGRNQKSQNGRQQTGAQCWSHCSIFQLPQKAIWEECGGSRVWDQEEEVLLVLHLQPGRVHHTHRDDVHQPEPYRSPVYLVISIFSSSWLLHYSVLSFRKSLN